MWKQTIKPAYHLDEVLFLLRHVIYSVALRLQVLQHFVNAAKDIQVGGCANIALVRWEAEDCDGHLLLSNLLLREAAIGESQCQGIAQTKCLEPVRLCVG